MHPYFEGKVTPTRGQILCTEPLGVRVLSQMCYADYGYEYFRQLPDGRLLVGGWRHHFRDTEVGYEDRTTPGVQRGLEVFMARYFPEVVAMLAALKPKLYLIDQVDSRSGPIKQCAASRFPPVVTLDEGGARAQQTGHGSSP